MRCFYYHKGETNLIGSTDQLGLYYCPYPCNIFRQVHHGMEILMSQGEKTPQDRSRLSERLC